jgi:hypothetical protein
MMSGSGQLQRLVARFRHRFDLELLAAVLAEHDGVVKGGYMVAPTIESKTRIRMELQAETRPEFESRLEALNAVLFTFGYRARPIKELDDILNDSIPFEPDPVGNRELGAAHVGV